MNEESQEKGCQLLLATFFNFVSKLPEQISFSEELLYR